MSQLPYINDVLLVRNGVLTRSRGVDGEDESWRGVLVGARDVVLKRKFSCLNTKN